MLSLYERATIIPGRSMTRSKAPGRLMKAWTSGRAEGAVIWDTDDRPYLDMVCGLGAISLGYRPRQPGGVYSLPHVREVEAAETVLAHVAPWASSVRFVKTGSEATHAAYRIAKAATGRSVIWIRHQAYHGWHEWCADGSAAHEIYDGNGFPTGPAPAAIFIEPQRFPDESTREWLRMVRRYCGLVGALLVFDEMIYGGRWALGGATEYYGVRPDLACYGKAFGNGDSIAFIVGRDALAEHGELVSGTFSGDVGGLNAVCETVQTYLQEPVIETLWERGRQLGAGLRQVIPSSIATLDGDPPLQRIQFTTPDYREAFKTGMHQRGVLIWPDWFMTMYAHTPKQIDQVIAAAEATCRTLS